MRLQAMTKAQELPAIGTTAAHPGTFGSPAPPPRLKNTRSML